MGIQMTIASINRALALSLRAVSYANRNASDARYARFAVGHLNRAKASLSAGNTLAAEISLLQARGAMRDHIALTSKPWAFEAY